VDNADTVFGIQLLI
jgi:hypothetical protein